MTVQGPINNQQPNGMSHTGGGRGGRAATHTPRADELASPWERGPRVLGP